MTTLSSPTSLSTGYNDSETSLSLRTISAIVGGSVAVILLLVTLLVVMLVMRKRRIKAQACQSRDVIKQSHADNGQLPVKYDNVAIMDERQASNNLQEAQESETKESDQVLYLNNSEVIKNTNSYPGNDTIVTNASSQPNSDKHTAMTAVSFPIQIRSKASTSRKLTHQSTETEEGGPYSLLGAHKVAPTNPYSTFEDFNYLAKTLKTLSGKEDNHQLTTDISDLSNVSHTVRSNVSSLNSPGRLSDIDTLDDSSQLYANSS